MSSTYDGTIPVAQSILSSLAHILNQASQHPKAENLLSSRLYEDMYPLADQIRLATQFSEYLVARLTGREPIKYEGSPQTFAQCHERIDTVLQALKDADKEVVNQHAEVVAETALGPEFRAEMSGAAYAHTLNLPNIYFHLVTAYGILRKEGVPLGKKDYYVGFFPNHAGAR